MSRSHLFISFISVIKNERQLETPGNIPLTPELIIIISFERHRTHRERNVILFYIVYLK